MDASARDGLLDDLLRDLFGDQVLGVEQGPEERSLVSHVVVGWVMELTVLDAIGSVDRTAGGTAEWRVLGHATTLPDSSRRA
jgi:hypothetical protein